MDIKNNPHHSQQHYTNNVVHKTRHQGNRSFVSTIAIVLIAITIATAGAIKLDEIIKTKSSVKSNEYQAVFLNNNMVYFGKVAEINDKFIKITNVYYLQNSKASTASASTDIQQQSQLSLTKLGGEIHGPEDAMYINSKEVLFWENLKPDSKVSSAIRNNSK
ncbi:MAG: hypothetical protein WCH00_01430 [Candidatus Saccharibacteria bacterium]